MTSTLPRPSASTSLSALTEASEALAEHITATRELRDAVEARAQEALRAGQSWNEIASSLGVTRQVARERFDPHSRVSG